MKWIPVTQQQPPKDRNFLAATGRYQLGSDESYTRDRGVGTWYDDEGYGFLDPEIGLEVEYWCDFPSDGIDDEAEWSDVV